MANTAERMTESEKSPNRQLSAGDSLPAKTESSSNDANFPEKAVDAKPSEKADDEKEKEKESQGGLKDYFVSGIAQGCRCCFVLMLQQRIFHYADRLDCILYAIAISGAVAVGAALPLMTLVFGSSTSSFTNYASGKASPQEFQAKVNHLVLYFVYLFVARFVIGYVATLCVCIAAARTTNSLRKAFLASLLRQQVSHFDMPGNGSPAAQVTTSM